MKFAPGTCNAAGRSIREKSLNMKTRSLLQKALTPLRIVTILSMLLALFAPFTQIDNVLAVGTRTTSMQVSCSVTSIVINQGTTCTATVTDNDTGTKSNPLGTVTWSITTGGTGTFSPAACSLATGSGNSSNCSVTFTPDAPSTGLGIVIKVDYGGDTLHAVKSAITSTGNNVNVTKRATSIVMSCVPSSVTIGTPTTCTATVSDASPAPTSQPIGTVNWNVNSGTGTFNSSPCTLASGTCSVTYTPSATTGVHGITAAYQGDTLHFGNNRTFSLTVTAPVSHTTTTSVSCSPNPALTGVATSCTATVTDTNGAPTIPTGTVSFTSGATAIGSCTLSSGTCSLSYTPSADGTFTITATYNADSTHSTSSGTTSLVVKIANTTTVSCNPNPDNVGGPTICTVIVTVDNSQPQPVGTVSFTSNGSGSFGTGGT